MPKKKDGAPTLVRFHNERDIENYGPITDDRKCGTPGLIDALRAISAEAARQFEAKCVPLVVQVVFERLSFQAPVPRV
jgi:hypothetical protein